MNSSKSEMSVLLLLYRDGDRFYFQLNRNGVLFRFTSEHIQPVERWRDSLRPYVIQGNVWSTFQFQGVLGKGAYGKVFYALDRATSTEVAIKILDKKVISTKVSGVDGLVREIRVHWEIKHCHGVLQLLEMFEDKDYVFLVLEF